MEYKLTHRIDEWQFNHFKKLMLLNSHDIVLIFIKIKNKKKMTNSNWFFKICIYLVFNCTYFNYHVCCVQ